MTRRRSIFAALLGLALVVPCSSARADVESEKGGELYSIEKRDLMGSHELSISLGALPLDAFVKGMTLQATYTYHFTDLIAWEIVGGAYAFNFSTNLEDQLQERFDVKPEKEPRLEALLDSNFVLKPLYGKIALFNDVLMTAEMFFVVGPALAFFESGETPFGADYGVGMRFFVGRYFSVRFDIRNYMMLPDFSEVENNLFLSLGLSLTFGFDDDEESD